MRMPPRVRGLLAVIALVSSGCGQGDGLPREPISGTVTLDGEPLELGSIQLYPTDQGAGIAVGEFIKDGRFEIARDVGPIPGTYSVMIFAEGQAPDPNAPPADEMPGEIQAKPAPRTGRIPIRYNFETELKAEVKAGEPNTYDFALKKK